MIREVIAPIMFLLLLTSASGQSLDASIVLTETYEKVVPDQNLWFSIIMDKDLFEANVKGLATYEIHKDGELVTYLFEDIVIDSSGVLIGNIRLPSNSDVGKYMLLATLATPIGKAAASRQFEVVKETVDQKIIQN